jgi:hypothetical protein
MKEVVSKEFVLTPEAAELAFKRHDSIVVAICDNEIYKLNTVKMNLGDNYEYAFIAINGKTWLNGSSKDIYQMIEQCQSYCRLLVFENEIEYFEWLAKKGKGIVK